MKSQKQLQIKFSTKQKDRQFSILKLNITKIECFGTGAIACQLIDCIHPTKVQLSKVNWKAKLEYEYVSNFKVLQQSLTKIGINKPIDVEKLTKCRYQDNLEFAQWIKKYFDSNGGAKSLQEYDPVSKRGNVEVDFSFIEGKGNAATSTATTINSKDSNMMQGKQGNQIRKQVAPRQATSIMISNEPPNELNRSQNLLEQKEQKEPNNFNYNIRGQNQIYESVIINQRKSSNSSNSSAQSKPFNKNMIKNVQSSYEINSFYNNSNFLLPVTNNNNNNNNNHNMNHNNNIIISSYTDQNSGNQVNQKLQEEREFYFSKLKNIDHLLELYEEMNLGEEVDELVFKLKDILYSTPEQQITIQPDSNVQVTQKQNQLDNINRKIFVSEYVDQIDEDNN